VIVVAVLLAYAGSLTGPFLFDDLESIAGNPTIRHFSSVLSPPMDGSTVTGRPVLNLSFAVNYAISGTEVWSYHALNLLIHILAGLTLFGVVRRTLRLRSGQALRLRSGQALARTGDSDAVLIGFSAALLWALHPLQTESVAYIAQRAESLMGLFYLLTLYCFIRGICSERADASGRFAGRAPGGCRSGTDLRRAHPNVSGDRGGSSNVAQASRPASSTTGRCAPWVWYALGVGFCLLGMGTKEVMVTAPAMVLLYDRTFVGGSFREAWKRRRLFYVCLAGTWLLTVVLVVGNHGRGGTAGFASGMPWWAYGLTQFRAIAHYLRLSVWPDPLIFDYGRMLGGKSVGLAVDAAVIAGLAAVSVLLFLRRRPLGFLGIWCFAILLPSSSVVPVATEVIAEHRMYLSLAAVLAAIVGGVSALSGILRAALGLTSRGVAILGISACLAAAAVLGFATARRIDLYRSPRAIWADTVSKVPQNPGARNNLGIALAAEGDLTGAEAQYRAALALAPDLADVHNNLANVLAKKGLLSEAVANYQAALQFRLRDPGIHEDLGTALLRLGRLEEARGHFEEALRLDPESSVGHFDMGNLLDREGQLQAAASQYRETLRLDPGYSRAWYNLGNLFARTGRFAEAAEAYASAVRLRPDFADAHVNYGNVLTELDRTSEAIGEFQAALRLQPGAADVHDSLGGVFAKAGRWTEARIQFEEALRLDPGDRDARANLERIDAAHGTRSGP